MAERKVTPEMKHQMLDMLERGWSRPALARHFGISVHTVEHHTINADDQAWRSEQLARKRTVRQVRAFAEVLAQEVARCKAD